MTEKESIKNHFLFKSYRSFGSKDPSVMKQKVSRGLCGKVQNNVSFKRNGCEADRRAPPVRFEISNGENRARRCPIGAVVAGGDPRRGRGIGRYQRVHHVLPHLWVVELSVSEHHVDGGPQLWRTVVRVSVGLAGESCGGQIEVGVSLLVVVQGYEQE